MNSFFLVIRCHLWQEEVKVSYWKSKLNNPRMRSSRGAARQAVSLNKLDGFRQSAVEQLKQVRYFFRQAQWLMVRFPDARLRNVEGLVKLVDHQELKANDWSLTPGRYVGVAPEEVDEDFDFEEALRDIHIELKGLNEEAVILAEAIAKNFEELGI